MSTPFDEASVDVVEDQQRYSENCQLLRYRLALLERVIQTERP